METLFNFVPEELLILILHNINTYRDLVNLYEFDAFNKILKSKIFWKNLFDNSFGDLINSVHINLNNLDIYYISAMYTKALNAYVKTINRVNNIVKEVNNSIKKYYPEMDMNNIDLDKIEDDKDELLSDETIDFSVNGRYIKDISLLFYRTDKADRNFRKHLFGEFLSENNDIDNIVFYVGYLGFSMNIHFDVPVFMGLRRVNLFTELTKNEFIKILFHAYFNGYVEK